LEKNPPGQVSKNKFLLNLKEPKTLNPNKMCTGYVNLPSMVELSTHLALEL
jgi:hypothetical protein